jgi:hypothetical protein
VGGASGSATYRRWSDVDGVFALIRNTLTELVGFAGRHHRHPILGSTGAYEVAYWKLYDAVAGLRSARAGSAEESLETERGENEDRCGGKSVSVQNGTQNAARRSDFLAWEVVS